MRCALPGPLAGAVRRPAAEPALAATLVSTLLSVGGALLIALTIVAALAFGPLAAAGFPSPLLLAVPHLALGDGGAAAVRRRGWLWQQLPF